MFLFLATQKLEPFLKNEFISKKIALFNNLLIICIECNNIISDF